MNINASVKILGFCVIFFKNTPQRSWLVKSENLHLWVRKKLHYWQIGFQLYDFSRRWLHISLPHRMYHYINRIIWWLLLFMVASLWVCLSLQEWPESDYPYIPVGKLVLNKNPSNYFTDVEQIAFAPSHMIPGIEPSPDKLLQVSYRIEEVSWNQHSKANDGQLIFAPSHFRKGEFSIM